jgi:hypothetical protein
VRRERAFIIDGGEKIAGRRRDAPRRGVALRQQGACERDVVAPVGLDQHPAQSRMQRQVPEAIAECRDTPAADRPELLEQEERRLDALARRRVEPLERARIAAPGEHVEHGVGEIDSMDLGLAVRPQPIRLAPEAPHAAGSQASGPAGALRRGVGGNPLEVQRIDAAVRIVACDLVQAGVDDSGDAGNGQRRLRDVRGQDDAPRRACRDGAILIGRR